MLGGDERDLVCIAYGLPLLCAQWFVPLSAQFDVLPVCQSLEAGVFEQARQAGLLEYDRF